MKKIKSIVAFVCVFMFCFMSLNVNGAVAGVQVTTDLGARNFQQLDVKVVANRISVSGIAGAAEVARITFYMVEGSSVVYVKEIKSAADGTFEADLVLTPDHYNAANTGTLIVGSTNANSRKIEGIELYSQAELDSCVNDFMAIGSAADMTNFISTYATMLAISASYTPEEMGLLYTRYSENPPTSVTDCDEVIAAIDSMVTYVDDYRALFAQINAAAALQDHAEVKNLLTNTYRHIIPFDTSAGLVQNETAMYQKMVAAYTTAYTSFADIENAFSAARIAQRDEEAVNGYVTTDRSKSFDDSKWKISVNANYITISGKTDDVGEHNLAFYVSDYNPSDPQILGLYQTKTNTDGTFTAEFAVDENIYGSETKGFVKIGGPDRNIYQFVIDLVPQATLNSMMTEFKAIASAPDSKAALTAFFANHGSDLNIGTGYTMDKVKIFDELYNENDFAGITETDLITKAIMTLDTTMMKVRDFVNNINNCKNEQRWGLIKDAIEGSETAEIAETSQKFANLRNTAVSNNTVSKKGIYMRMFDNSDFECVQDIYDAYNAAFTAQQAFENANNVSDIPTTTPEGPSGGTGGGGGGGGAGGGNTSVQIDPGLIPDGPKEPLVPEKMPVASFDDLEGYDWAKEAIDGLRNLSIVRGDGNGSFRPGDEVTREEFLSMLLSTFYITPETGKTPFKDVKENEWYTDVVNTAYSLGITNGMGDGNFGIGQKIVRADMVVFAARLANSRGIVIKKTQEAKIFNDFPQIPGYAYNDIVAFQQAGLIQGDGTGSFNPANPLTRAESAVFFWNIFNLIESQI